MFMGDSGAMLLGFLMATSVISLTGQLDPSRLDASGAGVVAAYLPVLLPFAVLGFPLLDLVLAYVRRTLRGQMWYHPDKQHLHHRMLNPEQRLQACCRPHEKLLHALFRRRQKVAPLAWRR